MTNPNAQQSDEYLAHDRVELVAVVSFLDGVASGRWDAGAVRDWFARHVTRATGLPVPGFVTESPVGPVSLHSGHGPLGAAENHLRRVLAAARARTIAAIRGLRFSPADDRFLAAEIFAGRARRDSAGGCWVARPNPWGPLSSLLITLVTVDVLSHRERYDNELCLCDICGRLWFDSKGATRRRCFEHLPAEDVPARRLDPGPPGQRSA